MWKYWTIAVTVGLLGAAALDARRQPPIIVPFASPVALDPITPPCPVASLAMMLYPLQDGLPQTFIVYHCQDGRILPVRYSTLAAIPASQGAPPPFTFRACPGTQVMNSAGYCVQP